MNAGYGTGQRLLELASIGAFAALSLCAVARLAGTTGPWLPLWVALGVPAGWLAADLLSGVVHWAFDSFGSATTPVIGPGFIRPFRAHHADPEEMTRHDFVETHGASCLAALPLLVAAVLVPLDSPGGVLVQVVALCTALGVLFTNQCHKWAHMEEAATPAAVRWAQRRRLILPRQHHERHHTPPFNTHFCMSSGWLNRPFDAVLRRWR